MPKHRASKSLDLIDGGFEVPLSQLKRDELMMLLLLSFGVLGWEEGGIGSRRSCWKKELKVEKKNRKDRERKLLALAEHQTARKSLLILMERGSERMVGGSKEAVAR